MAADLNATFGCTVITLQSPGAANAVHFAALLRRAQRNCHIYYFNAQLLSPGLVKRGNDDRHIVHAAAVQRAQSKCRRHPITSLVFDVGTFCMPKGIVSLSNSDFGEAYLPPGVKPAAAAAQPRGGERDVATPFPAAVEDSSCAAAAEAASNARAAKAATANFKARARKRKSARTEPELEDCITAEQALQPQPRKRPPASARLWRLQQRRTAQTSRRWRQRRSEAVKPKACARTAADTTYTPLPACAHRNAPEAFERALAAHTPPPFKAPMVDKNLFLETFPRKRSRM
ncbi:hypothetical protein JKP88DRAFT_244329 [Tribonema minus]|uniref:Uncharacterized protein n=1 Tax=Tribonema minus TaxID=303371 RepID=A0A836CHS0_9STRA|nr:hypothetical protein JKP88DRAFT_244329 [Tribonema minus]